MKNGQLNPMRNRQQFPKTRRPMRAEMARPASVTTANNTTNKEEYIMEKTAVKVAEIENTANPNQDENMDTRATVETGETNPTSEEKQMTSNPSPNSAPQPEVQLSCLRHKSSSTKINLIRKALIAGMSREEICFQGQISGAVFNSLYFSLCQLDGKFYEVKHKYHILNGKVNEKGFTTSMDKIIALGLDHIFHDGAQIRYSKTANNKMLIEVIEQAQLPEDFDDLEGNGDNEAIKAQEEMDMGVEEMEYEEEAEAEEVEGEIDFDRAGA